MNKETEEKIMMVVVPIVAILMIGLFAVLVYTSNEETRYYREACERKGMVLVQEEYGSKYCAEGFE